MDKRYIIYVREPGLSWFWGWYLLKICTTEEPGRERIEDIRKYAHSGVQVALLEWQPDFEHPLPTVLYFRWHRNTRLLFRGTIPPNAGIENPTGRAELWK